MKIAICFSGQLRNIQSTFLNWYKPNVLDVNQDHEIDIFVHSWFDKNTIGSVHYAANRVPNSVVASDPVPEDIIQQMYGAYNPIATILQKPKTFDEKNYNERKLPDAVPAHGLSRLYSIFRSVQLKAQYEAENNFKYDVVACARFDFMFKEPFKFDLVNEPGIYHPGYSPHGFNVCYAMGDTDSINQYALLYQNVEIVYNTGIAWCDEILANTYLNMCGIPVYDFKTLNGINRGTNT